METLRTILLAEDNQMDIELTLDALSEFNLANRVVVVNDGVEVLEFLNCEGKFTNREKGNPVVIILDIKMPRMNGLEVLEKIRITDGFKKIPTVMLTSSQEHPDLKKSYDLGVNAYVVKPVDFKDFIVAVKHLGIFWAMINESPLEN